MASSAPVIEATSSLNDDVVLEILLRLPCASVLRCRAVCRAWRGIASSPLFVAAYSRSRHRPLELVVQRHGANGVLDTVPLATLDEASLRCLHPGYPNDDNSEYTLMGSCGDLLLFKRDRGMAGWQLWVCSPVTRQWSAVPLPHGNGLMLLCGLYLHRPSGEHRLLFLANDTRRDMSGPASHYVGSLELETYRRLGPALATVHVLSQGMLRTDQCLDYHGKLHWLAHPEVRDTDKILAFDTVSETFRRTMSRPPPLLGTNAASETPSMVVSLLEMDGRLAMAVDTRPDGMDLWVLEDYDSESWTCRHRIDLSALSSSSYPCCWAMGASASYDDQVIVLGDMAGLSVVLYHLTEKTVLKRIQVAVPNKSGRRTYMSTLVSLETHGFFNKPTNS